MRINVDDLKIESDEQGFELHLWVDDWPRMNEEGRIILNIHGVAEDLYDQVKASIGPYLYERDLARASRPARLTEAEREEEIRCAALGLEGPNVKQYRYEEHGS